MLDVIEERKKNDIAVLPKVVYAVYDPIERRVVSVHLTEGGAAQRAKEVIDSRQSGLPSIAEYDSFDLEL